MKTFIVLTIYALIIGGQLTQQHFENEVQAQHEIPSYAKWGQIAMKETQKKYPESEIVDYLHIGRETDKNTSTEKFKLWLVTHDKEFGVLINIKFKTDTEEILNIEFTEVAK